MSCQCHQPPFDYRNFDTRWVGTDETQGRFGEVTVETCRECNSDWLRYFVEYEGFSRSGRWYRGLVPREVAQSVSAASAVAILDELEWLFFGGSYFGSTGEQGCGPLRLGIYG